MCVIGYVAGKSPGFKALNGISSSVWKCEASLTVHDSGWLIYQFNCEEDKNSVLCGGPYMVYGRPLILKSMPQFFDFSREEISRVPVWIRFPNLPLCCWSPTCLSKIASFLGKPIQSDQVTSTLSRMLYARVLVEVDLSEDLKHFVAVSLPSGPILHQKVVYEALPKFCTYCTVLGHTRILCSKATAHAAEAMMDPAPPIQARNGSVFDRLGPQLLQQNAPSQAVLTPSVDPTEPVHDNELVPCDASAGWITVAHRKKAVKHKCTSPKGKEVVPDDMAATPSICTDTVGSPSVIDSALDIVVARPSSCRAHPNLDANTPTDPPHRQPHKLLTFTDNRKTSPLRVPTYRRRLKEGYVSA